MRRSALGLAEVSRADAGRATICIGRLSYATFYTPSTLFLAYIGDCCMFAGCNGMFVTWNMEPENRNYLAANRHFQKYFTPLPRWILVVFLVKSLRSPPSLRRCLRSVAVTSGKYTTRFP